MISKLIKGKEVAEILNISKAFAYRLMAEGQIPTIKMGRSVRVMPEDLERFIQDSSRQSQDVLFSDGRIPTHLHNSKV